MPPKAAKAKRLEDCSFWPTRGTCHKNGRDLRPAARARTVNERHIEKSLLEFVQILASEGGSVDDQFI